MSTFDTQLTDSKFRNFPPLLFRPPRQNRLAKKPSWAVHHNLNKNWAKPAKTWRSLLTSQLIPAPLGGRQLRRWSVCEIFLNANTQLNKMNQFFTHFQSVLTSLSFFEKFTHFTTRVSKIYTKNHRSIFLSIEKVVDCVTARQGFAKISPNFRRGIFRG